jgi:hypothetical protein
MASRTRIPKAKLTGLYGAISKKMSRSVVAMTNEARRCDKEAR